VRKRILSFKYAFAGIGTLLKEEPNARIHVAVAGVVIGLGVYFDIYLIEWLAIAGCIGMVLFAEAINSSIEALADHVSPERHPQIKKVKDLAAAGVLFVAITAAVIGVSIFWPYVFSSS
jgi:diacylglycerol kinase